MATVDSLHIGQTVLFGKPHGEKTPGTVLWFNAKSVKIKTLKARGRHAAGTNWRVGYSLITVPAEQQTEKPVEPKRPKSVADLLRGL